MKMRKGYRVIWSDGTEWDGDCPKWADEARKVGNKVETIRIMGSGRWPCSGCALGSH